VAEPAPLHRPDPAALAPAHTSRWSLTFDRPMRPEGRLRLSWGRIAAHQINAGARRFEWAAGAGPLRWAGDRELALELPAPLGAGFRVRAEWTGLVTAAGEALPPVREVVALAPAAPWSGVPRVYLWPPPGPAPVDLRVELTADRPLARVEGLRLRCGADDIPFRVTDNRNPPDWLYVLPRVALPDGARVRLDGVAVCAAGGRAAFAGEWTVAAPRPEVDPARSEPPPGQELLPVDEVVVCLRLRRAAALDPGPGAVALLDPDGRPVPGLELACDPAPGHYGAVFLRSGPGFPGLRPGAAYALRFGGLGPGGAGAPGGWALRTAAAGEDPVPLAPLATAMSLFATPAGTWAQAVLMLRGPTRAAGARLRLVGEPAPFEAALEGPFVGTFAEQAGGRPDQLLRLSPAAAPLPPGLGDRAFEVELVDARGRARRFAAQAHDLGRDALTDLRWEGPALRWRHTRAVDHVHVAILEADGTPVFAGHAPGCRGPADGAFGLPGGVAAPGPGRRAQLWALRARPEDDLWDYFVAEIAFEGPP